MTWALALLSSVEVQHLATEAHYVIEQSQNRGREKNNVIDPKAGSGHHLKKSPVHYQECRQDKRCVQSYNRKSNLAQ